MPTPNDRQAFRAVTKEAPEEYARRRVAETGKSYIVTGVGNVLMSCTHNRKLAEDMLGGIALVFSPVRSTRVA